MDVELCDVGARCLAGVGQVRAHRHGAVGCNGGRRQPQIGESEARVREAVAERVQGRVRHVEVLGGVLVVRVRGPTGLELVVIDRDLADVPGEGHRQLAAGVHLAEEYVSYGVSPLDTWLPRFQECRCVVREPVDGQGATIHQHHHVRLPGCGHRLDQCLLLAGQVDVGSGRGLTAVGGRFADNQHRQRR